MSEQDIQRKIKKDLEAKGCYVTKYNANGYGVSGHADLVVSVPVTVPSSEYWIVPICLYVEVKAKTGRLSLIQKIWHREMEKNGHWVVVARSTDEVLHFLASQGVHL